MIGIRLALLATQLKRHSIGVTFDEFEVGCLLRIVRLKRAPKQIKTNRINSSRVNSSRVESSWPEIDLHPWEQKRLNPVQLEACWQIFVQSSEIPNFHCCPATWAKKSQFHLATKSIFSTRIGAVVHWADSLIVHSHNHTLVGLFNWSKGEFEPN